MSQVPVKDFFIGPGQPLMLMSGPCVIEGEDHCLRAAEFLVKHLSELPVHFIFKSSYDKANRTSVNSYRGPGVEEGLRILERVRREFSVPVVTDVHTPQEAVQAAEVCDVIKVPAFLCRQTDLVVAAGKTGCVVNISKGQFLAPWDVKNIIEKVVSTGNDKVFITDRGTMFGYNNLVSDMRGIPIIQKLGAPVCFDACHSVQLPGGLGAESGGEQEFIPTLTKAAVAAGCDALYLESHPKPCEAKCDAASVLGFNELIPLLRDAVRIREVLQVEPTLR